jgi:hypothetical protein
MISPPPFTSYELDQLEYAAKLLHRRLHPTLQEGDKADTEPRAIALDAHELPLSMLYWLALAHSICFWDCGLDPTAVGCKTARVMLNSYRKRLARHTNPDG